MTTQTTFFLHSNCSVPSFFMQSRRRSTLRLVKHESRGEQTGRADDAGRRERGRGKERERERFPSVSHARSTSACGRWGPGAVLQAPAPSDALHGVATKARVHRHVPELERCPPNHPVGHAEGGATEHPCTTAQMERPAGYTFISLE